MNRKYLVIGALCVMALLTVAFFATLSQAQSQSTLDGGWWAYYYIYSVPFIVSSNINLTHPSAVGVGPGVYETDILVHNPAQLESGSAKIRKKLVEAFDEKMPQQAPIWFAPTYFWLGPDRAFRIDSTEIISVLGVDTTIGVHKGYVGILSTKANLDVVAFYTVSEVKFVAGQIRVGNTTSIETLTITSKNFGWIWG